MAFGASTQHGPKRVVFNFHHTQVGMQVRVQDHMGVWHDFELVRYLGATLDTALEERLYANHWRAVGYEVEVAAAYH